MAIQIDLQNSQYGVPFAGAYFRIVSVTLTRTRDSNKHNLMIDVAGYATQPENNDTREVDFRRYSVNLFDVESISGTTFLSKCYAWVMQQPDMLGSIGV